MNIFQLFGEIAIDNSKANEQIDKTTKGAKKLASTMKSAFATAGKAAVKAGKVIAAGVAAGTAAMGKLVKTALDGYADYEQLEDGVKKLFGEDAQKLVMEYAKNAYKTAGLSANEYMDTVTSFSASLISSLGNDTVAAAKYADIAITDMADNANTFGTSMEDIQNAYKGFSKQNYTMLDNLKLGYGGTQKEMERLLEDASKLSGVKYNISNFSDIIEAIHVIQEQQGIAETTANEAATTISGSLGMVKGAWGNLLSGLMDGNQDIDQLVGNLTDSVLTAADNIIPRLQTSAPRLVQAVQTLVSTLAPQLPGIINSILPGMVEAATTLIGGLADVLPDLLGSIIDVLPNVVKQIGGALKKLFPSLLKTFKSLIGKIDFKGLGTAIGSGLRSIVTNLPTIMQGIGSAIKWAWENIAYPLIQGIFKGIFGIDLPEWDTVVDSITTWWNDNVVAGLYGALTAIWTLFNPDYDGTDIVGTISEWWDGVVSSIGEGLSLVWRLFNPGEGDDTTDIVTALGEWWGGVTGSIGDALGAAWKLLDPSEDGATLITNWWNGATKLLGDTLSLVWKLFNPDGNIGAAIEEWWKDAVENVKNQLALMWHLLNPFNIAKQVKNAWDRATKGLNLTVGWKTVQQTVEILTNPETNPLNPDSHYQQVISTPEGRGAMRNAGWEVIKSFFTHADGAVFSKPTLFDTHSGYHLVGEAGEEAVAPIGVLQGYVKSAVAEAMGSGMERKLDQMLTVLGEGFSGMNQPIILDTGVLVGSTAGKMDKRLGRMAARKGRNA